MTQVFDGIIFSIIKWNIRAPKVGCCPPLKKAGLWHGELFARAPPGANGGGGSPDRLEPPRSIFKGPSFWREACGGRRMLRTYFPMFLIIRIIAEDVKKTRKPKPKSLRTEAGPGGPPGGEAGAAKPDRCMGIKARGHFN